MKFRKSYQVEIKYEVVVHNKISVVEGTLDVLSELEHEGCYISEKSSTNITEKSYGTDGAVFYVSVLNLTLNVYNPLKTINALRKIRGIIDLTLKVQSESISWAITQHRDLDHLQSNNEGQHD